ncbi:MAG: hypothetical protein Q4D89_05495 [Arachnia propionica]|uniref:hypothetical protein n=1 Tax=Arachnia propionica TaxID=1750 RepID=UPI00270B853B|nr:hypothetical protein [Arachnia propionica]
MHDTKLPGATHHPELQSDMNRTAKLFLFLLVTMPLLGMLLGTSLALPTCKTAWTECHFNFLNDDSFWEGLRSSTLGITSLTAMLFVAIILTEGNNLKELRPQHMVLLENFLYAMCTLGGMMSGMLLWSVSGPRGQAIASLPLASCCLGFNTLIITMFDKRRIAADRLLVLEERQRRLSSFAAKHRKARENHSGLAGMLTHIFNPSLLLLVTLGISPDATIPQLTGALSLAVIGDVLLKWVASRFRGAPTPAAADSVMQGMVGVSFTLFWIGLLILYGMKYHSTWPQVIILLALQPALIIILNALERTLGMFEDRRRKYAARSWKMIRAQIHRTRENLRKQYEESN